MSPFPRQESSAGYLIADRSLPRQGMRPRRSRGEALGCSRWDNKPFATTPCDSSDVACLQVHSPPESITSPLALVPRRQNVMMSVESLRKTTAASAIANCAPPLWRLPNDMP